MIKFLLSTSLILLCSFSYAQVTTTIQWQKSNVYDNGDTIYYNPNIKLVWSDFKGKPDAGSLAAAITESGFGYKMTMQSLNGRMNINIIVYCYFNKKRSWVKRNMDTDYALLHEQHHFDITYINTCLFVKKLKAAKFTTGNFTSIANSIYDECYKALGTMQDEYDGQTSNGRVKKIQEDWNKKIDNMLADLIIN